jgi:hypothetical protein
MLEEEEESIWETITIINEYHMDKGTTRYTITFCKTSRFQYQIYYVKDSSIIVAIIFINQFQYQVLFIKIEFLNQLQNHETYLLFIKTCLIIQ